jgi:hypothetical protein
MENCGQKDGIELSYTFIVREESQRCRSEARTIYIILNDTKATGRTSQNNPKKAIKPL